MSEDETPPPRFAGRTYSRSKQKPAGRGLDDTADGKTVPLKASVSISKWGKANYVPFREGSDGSTDTKRQKLENKGEDPFSFDTDDKRKPSPVKKATVPPPKEPHHSTKLPASRIVLKDEDNKKLVDFNKDDDVKSSALRTYARTSAKTPIIFDQFIEVGKTEITGTGETKFYPGINLAAKDSPTEMDYESEDEEIFPVEFKRDPLKTYSGEVVTPVDKPDSPPPRKSGYKKKGGPRGRKPLTVSDPGLIEEYKRNYAAQQLKGKPDTAIGGLNNSTVVSKQEVANEDQGTTVVVVCKPKKPVEKVETHTKTVKPTVPKSRGLFTITLEPAPQESAGENGNSESAGTAPVSVPNVSLRAQTRNSSLVAANSEGISSSQSINAGSQSSQSQATPKRRLAHDKSGATDSSSSQSILTPSSIDISQGETSTGRGKRYRIFKSRAPHVEEELKPPVFGDELDEDISLTSSNSQQLADSSQSSGTGEQEKVVYVEIEKGSTRGRKPLTVSDPALIEECKQNYSTAQQLKLKPDTEPGGLSHSAVLSKKEVANEEVVYVEIGVAMDDLVVNDLPFKSSQNATSVDTVEFDADSSSTKQIDQSAARESLAARLRNLEKNNDSDSTGEPDNLSESSENLQSQGSPFNSQSTVEDGSQKEASSPPRKFFKSKKFSLTAIDHHRKLLGGSPQKGSPAKVTYNARTWNNENDVDEEKETNSIKSEKDEDIVLIKDSSKGPKLKREVHYPERHYDEAYTSLRVSKTHKELYTVVHHVKQSHEVQELGETQDFMDEVDYLLDSLQDTKSKSIRCLSCLKLAGKCISPAFRMHMRAHGTVTKIFSLLHDACSDPCLALSTSAMMFMLSRDRLNMDLDKDSLNLMLKLNEIVDTADNKANVSGNGDLEKTKQRVQELLAQLQQETHAREIDLGFVSTGNLALESLLSLTSRRAGEWFKEELRSFGGLDHIVDSVRKCEKSLPDDFNQGIQNVLPALRKLDRCLRVLENISFMNSDNQNYLIAYKNAALLQSCTRLLRICQKCMPMYSVQESIQEKKEDKESPGFTVLTCMLAVLRVLLNVTHEHKLGDLEPSDETSLMATIVKCLTTTQWCIPVEQRFDLAILCLGLLINMVENRETNRKIMMEMETQVKYTEKEQAKTMSAIKAVVELFVQREQAARELEEDTETAPDTSSAESPNKSGEWKESDSGIQWITNSLKKAKEEEEKSKTPLGSNKGGGDGEDANQTILEDDDETFTRALLKAGKHMENSIVASYAGLLLGTTIINSKEYGTVVKQLIPHEDFGPMIKMLKKFLNFMSLTTAFGSTDVNNITKVINVLESA